MAINLNIAPREGEAGDLGAHQDGAATFVSAMLTTLGEALGGFDERLARLEQAVGQALFEAGSESKALVRRLDDVVSRAATRVEARVDDAVRDRAGDAEVLDALGVLATRTGAMLDESAEVLRAALAAQAPELSAALADRVAAVLDDRVASLREAIEARVTDDLVALSARIDAGHRQLANYLRDLLGAGLKSTGESQEAAVERVLSALDGLRSELEAFLIGPAAPKGPDQP